ncbi:MAG: acetyl-CoA carboxylase, carboxyltransferase subunit beta [candidate division Zixibacteria bacterium]|nr:acetyl-CoA carboxylase, carboxyltransferase subunit beta [candidate division Zixibacteria bacterium]MCI0595254.1 acetyl-CoA carboxylase, carboxyltransferase subunit beta [candidate division Zixibacteria bacterium]
MEWFKKTREGIAGGEKKEIPKGLWTKCESCGEIIFVRELEKNLWVCPKCNYHFRIRYKDYLELLLDPGAWTEYDRNIVSADPLRFKDSKRYSDRIRDARKKTELPDAVVAGVGKIGGREVSLAAMDFSFIGGSMGSVVGEKIARAIERSLERKIPLIIVSCSGGARMQEGILSLMQMAKTAALLAQLQKKNLPFISVLTNPTTAGVMASYASLGDVIIAEPKALLGFAGPRVIAQTIGQELPPGFQSSEFFLEHGFLDMICERKELRRAINLLLEYFSGNGRPRA